jgi:hypothetical protein
MIQLLSASSPFFCGVAYDFKLSGIDNRHIIELLDADNIKIIQCIEHAIYNQFEITKEKFNQIYKPQLSNFNVILKDYALRNKSFSNLHRIFMIFIIENDVKPSLFHKYVIINFLYFKALIMQNLYKYLNKLQSN